jgi:hypothetical protein
VTSLVRLGYGLAFVATILSWTVAQKDREHLPVAYFLTLGIVADLAKRAVWLVILGAAYERSDGAALTGSAHFARAVHDALFLMWPAGVAALSIRVYEKKNPWLVAPVYAFVVVICAIGYPTIRGVVHHQLLMAVDSAAVVVGVAYFVQWFWRQEHPTPAIVSASLILGIEGGLLVGGPYRSDPAVHWDLAQVMFVLLYAALVVVQGVTWISRSNYRASS